MKFQDTAEADRFYFKMTGQQIVTAKSDNDAELTLDSTATTGAKKWTIRSDRGATPAGSLMFINETDTGNPTVEFEPGGDIYTPGFIGCKITTAAPADGDGRLGAIAVDTTNKRIWVKVADTGADRWWYASLVSP